MLNSSSYQIDPPEEAGLEPAMIKILLGIIYKYQGQEIISLSAFDVMRRCLSGVIPSQVTFKWLSSIDELRKRSPFAGSDHEFGHYEHTIWGACPDGQNFKGGVSLFGRTIVDITIDSFGQNLVGTLCTVPNRLPR